jgi:predicted DNA-binding transcriptional regulator YafY
MPANKNARVRYAVIDRMLSAQPNKYPSLIDIAEQCSRRLEKTVSVHCIEKDIRKLSNGEEAPMFPKAPIQYHHKNKGYYYAEQGFSLFQINLSESEWDALRYAALLLFQHKDLPVFDDFRSAIERISQSLDISLEPEETFDKRHVQFENPVTDAGFQWLPKIYQVIKNQSTMSFEYENIYKQTKKTYELAPYLLKEHRNRWYVIGWVESRQDYLTFALDRISGIDTDMIHRRLREDFNVDHFLQHSIGITEQHEPPVKVRLLIQPPFDRLLELEPLHRSQHIVRKNKNGMEITLHTYLNPEFYHRILSFGPYCMVKAPQKLAMVLRDLSKKTAAQYIQRKRG